MAQLPPGTRLGRVDPDALARDDAAAEPAGGRVEQTGIALVRRGETVLPGPGSQARLRDVPADGPAVRVEIAVTVELGPSVEDVVRLSADEALRRLRTALQARTVG